MTVPAEIVAPDPSTFRTEQTRDLVCSIVIPVHNKASLTRQCLNSLLAEHDLSCHREIIVVDDGSTDLTVDLLAAYGDRIQVVRNHTAIGFAGACNAGAGISTGDFLVLLNNDTLPTRGWLEALVNYAAAHPNAAVVGSKLLYPNNTIQHAGVVFGLDRYPHHLYAGFPGDHPATNTSRQFQAVTAACCLIRRDAWTQMGGLDRTFINGWEDVDLCLRLAAAGFEIHYCADSVLHHLESSTRDLRANQELENRQRFVSKWQHRIQPDDFRYYYEDELLQIVYPARYPIQVTVSPLLAGITTGESDRLADRILFERARQVAILLRNNIVLNVRVQEAEQRLQAAEERAARAEGRLSSLPSPEPLVAAAPSEAPEEQSAPEAPAAVASAPPAMQPILGRVESPSRQPGVVTDQVLPIAGWAMSQAGISHIETYVDDERLGSVEYGEIRPDVAALYPEFSNNEASGFVGGIPIFSLADGMHSLLIRIVARDGKIADIGTSFEVDSTAFTSGRVLTRTDRPAPGIKLRQRDRLFVAGWALSPYGVDTVEVSIDGEPRGTVAYGALRPDVARSYPYYPNVDHCGFSGSLPLNDLDEGSHHLHILVTATDGQQGELDLPFQIDPGAPVIGEAPQINDQYAAWLDANLPLLEDASTAMAAIAALEVLPSFDLVLPLLGAPVTLIQPQLDSIRAQFYPHWRLFLAVPTDASADVRGWARDMIQHDPRIGIGLIEATTFAGLANAAIPAGTGDWISVLQPGDRLSPAALSRMAVELAGMPDVDIVYTDEDKIDPDVGIRWDPFFKPDWSPELLLSRDYFGPLTMYRRATLGPSVYLNPAVPGSEHYDLTLRATEQSGRIHHVASVLVSRPRILGDPIQDWIESGEVALRDAMQRRGIAARIERGHEPGSWRVRHDIGEPPPVTIVMPSGGKMQYLEPCLDDLLNKTSYPNLDILILDNSFGDDIRELVDRLAPNHPNIRRVEVDVTPFNFSALINRALPHLTAPYTLLLNDDVTVVTPDWIESMMEQAQQPEIGITGAKLLYPDGSIQHAGVLLGPYEGTGHAFKFFPGEQSGYFGLPNVTRNYLAVTFACALMRTELLTTLGGLDEEHLPIAFNDVDFCLRVVEAGYRIVYTPYAVLIHHESVTKKVIAQPREIGFLRTRWGHYIAHDPYYNPNLTRRAEDGSLRFP